MAKAYKRLVTRGALRDSAVSLLSPTQDHINDLRHRGAVISNDRTKPPCARSMNCLDRHPGKVRRGFTEEKAVRGLRCRRHRFERRDVFVLGYLVPET
jgi:hypothetical protein